MLEQSLDVGMVVVLQPVNRNVTDQIGGPRRNLDVGVVFRHCRKFVEGSKADLG